MSRLIACFVSLFFAFFSAVPAARCDTVTIDDVTVSVIAEGASNVVSEWTPDDGQGGTRFFHFVYQTSGLAVVTVSLNIKDRPSTFYFENIALANWGYGWNTPTEAMPTLTPSGNSVAFTVDLRNLPAFYKANGSPLTMTLEFTVNDGTGLPSYSYFVNLNFFLDRAVEIIDNVVDNRVFVKIADLSLTPITIDPGYNWGVLVEKKAVLGETVTATSLGGNFTFLPESETLNTYQGFTTFGAASFVAIANTSSSPLRSGALGKHLPSTLPTAPILGDGSQLTDSVSIDVGGKSAGTYTIHRFFAVVDEVDGDVSVKPPLGALYSPLNMGDKLMPGSMLRLRKSSDVYGNIYFPALHLTFYDATNAAVSVVGSFQNDPNEALYVQVGQTGIAGTAPCDLITDTKNFVKGVMSEPREFGRVVIKKGIGTLAKLATGAYGFIYSTVAGQSTEHIIDAIEDAGRPRSLRSPRLSSALRTAWSGENATAFEVSLTDKGPVLYNRGTPLHIEYGAPTADGGFARSGISTDSPERSYLTLDPAGTFSGLKPLYPQKYLPLVPIEISAPAPDSTVDSLYSCLTVKYGASGLTNSSEPQLNSLSVRLNGVLVSPFMYPDNYSSTAQYCPPGDRPLAAGLNAVKAAISTYKAGRTFAATSFYATAGKPAAPRNVVPYSGTSRVILKWSANTESTVTKYRVLSAAGADKSVPGSLLIETSQTVHVLDAPAATGFYSVQACSDNLCSEESARVRVALNPGAIAAIPVISAVNGTASERSARLKITTGVPAPVAWKLYQGNSVGGPWSNVLGGDDALTANDSFNVSGLTNGATYYFRAVPVGLDLVEGAPRVTLPLTPQDAAPAAPLGVSVEFGVGGALVEWNPSPEAGLAGYNLYRSDDNGSFARVNTWGLLTDIAYTDEVPSEHSLAWKITAVDNTGHESQPSKVVYGSTWGLGSEGGGEGLKVFLPLVLSDFSQ